MRAEVAEREIFSPQKKIPAARPHNRFILTNSRFINCGRPAVDAERGGLSAAETGKGLSLETRLPTEL